MEGFTKQETQTPHFNPGDSNWKGRRSVQVEVSGPI